MIEPFQIFLFRNYIIIRKKYLIIHTIRFGGNVKEFAAPNTILKTWSEKQSKSILNKENKVKVHEI